MSANYLLKEHKDWIGPVQPIGIVVLPSALVNAQLRIQKDVYNLQEAFRAITDESGLLPLHLPSLFTRVLGWRTDDLISGEAVRSLDVFLPEREANLKADYAVKNADSGEIDILIKYIDQLQFDEDEIPEGRGWQASPHSKFERHLREKNLSIGILVNQFGLRLIYAPKGETSGYLTFPFPFMRETQGRPVLAALHLLLCEDRLFKGDPKQRLQNLLIESRKFQNEVSTKLSEQVLAALYELVRGLQEADEDAKGKLLEDVLKRDKNEVYHSLLTVLLRTVFTLYAEDRDLLSSDPVFLNNYSINGLFAKLREDASKYHDSMNFRYGAWAHLLSLFRLIYEGIELEVDSIPGRKGHLFDPDRFPFLEGRVKPEDSFKPPRISDGVVWRVLSNLMTLDGERISYRALDVEQIGSVYETVMGFQLEIATGPSIAIKPAKTHGAPVVVNLNDVLSTPGAKRTAKLKELTDIKFEGRIAESIKAARSVEELIVALGSKVADWATPTTVATGAMILQPSDARRRSGSHYTPRSLTAPIVAKALEPILIQLGDSPKPEQILALKICDPAMGSGAFLVETCRQVSELLVKSWAIHKPNIRAEIPKDEDELLYARRLIAQRCIYGVDKNPMAVNLAKLSIWLATFAKNHDFTFLNHCLKCGDSLVGLDLQQISGRTWEKASDLFLQDSTVSGRILEVNSVRNQIRQASESGKFDDLDQLKLKEDRLLDDLRSLSKAIVYSFFAANKMKAKKQELDRINTVTQMWFASGLPIGKFNGLRNEIKWVEERVPPLNWQIEFPEVFESSNPGFDVIVGNPPFIGGKKISTFHGEEYSSWIVYNHPETNGNVDIAAHFFRRCFGLLKNGGCAGLIATNSIAQGDTRDGGLRWICTNNGRIFNVVTRIKWPGVAVVVCTIHFQKLPSIFLPQPRIDERKVSRISAFLVESANDEAPQALTENKGLCTIGAYVFGSGFIFDDTDEDANPIELMNSILKKHPNYGELIFPYIGGEEINSDPEFKHRRYVINFGERSEEQAKEFYDLYKIVEQKVKPIRHEQKVEALKKKWWQFARTKRDLFEAIKTKELKRILVHPNISPHLAFAFLEPNVIVGAPHCVITDDSYSLFAVLQSRFHEIWARFYSGTSIELMRYTPSDCFDNFPLPINYQFNSDLNLAGQRYYELRSEIMRSKNIGMTQLYNLFHESSCKDQDIEKIRAATIDLDLAVANAYGWSDLQVEHTFQSYHDEESNEKPEIRLFWSEVLKDQVFGRLIELSSERTFTKKNDENGSAI